MSDKIRCYHELRKLSTYDERLEYLKLSGTVAYETFGSHRYLNQAFYQSKQWRDIRRQVILRDHGCDLGIQGYEIESGLVIHHMNPVSEEDILERSDFLLDPEYLICCTDITHRAIHYGIGDSPYRFSVARMPNDTCPWRKHI